MIAGIVKDSLEATIPLTLERDAGDVQPIEAEPLVGMAMLERHELRIQVISGGAVTVRALS